MIRIDNDFEAGTRFIRSLLGESGASSDDFPSTAITLELFRMLKLCLHHRIPRFFSLCTIVKKMVPLV